MPSDALDLAATAAPAPPIPLAPKHGSWIRDGVIETGVPAERWRGPRGLLALSSGIIVEYPDSSGEAGPTWFVSVSRRGARPTDKDMRIVRKAFFGRDADQADEDNHMPSIHRGMFMPVDPSRRRSCECKVTERTVVEPDGFRWTTPVDGPCRGCEWERMMAGLGYPWRKCPLHGKEAQHG